VSDMPSESSSRPKRSPAFVAVKWYSLALALMFLAYGGLKIVLGALDRDYSAFPRATIFLLVGLVLSAVCVAYRDGKHWGWYGLVVLNGIVLLLALIGITNVYNLPFLILSAAALALLFSRPLKAEIR